ncbi:RpiR family transcriptional regulator [Hydrogenispora ethanolica]|jgi:DNA-binding MurR/RpiR family transcriptional regulator|uniref:RpiR family transcriptional regulator n=1 Tax=Hydrogenispora ethanolica TaxID=1082276 RepID=A0A4R1RAF6_HYDET|nr:MurR/RpiR family transcriptional regulator [Hydrogenispora ethanolica]TCL62731.1 RpiR family transcriptional regulator [Hydrogenispora ethanolica]
MAVSGLERIREGRSALRDSEQRVAEHLLTHFQEAINLPITELAEQIGVSEATIVRMCKKLGFRGFQELKITLALDIVQPMQILNEEVQAEDDMETIAKKIFAYNKQAMDSTLNVLSVRELERAVEALAGAKQIQIYGVAGSWSVAADAAHKLMKTGIPVTAFQDTHMQAMAASLLGPGDVVIGISHSGSSKDIVEAVGWAKDSGATTIGITHYARTPLDRVLDIKLATCSNETHYRIEGLSSRVAQLSIIDTLFIGISLRNFDQVVKNIRRTREAIVPKRF